MTHGIPHLLVRCSMGSDAKSENVTDKIVMYRAADKQNSNIERKSTRSAILGVTRVQGAFVVRLLEAGGERS
jgi:hypothetical protein